MREVEGASAQDYRVSSAGSTLRLNSGSTGTVVIRLEALRGFHFSEETPLLASLSSSAGLSLAKQRLDRKDLATSTSTMLEWRTSYSARAIGTQSVKADLVFFLCTEDDCQRLNAPYAVTIGVE
ncbi:MAG: hypothetical protein IT381_14040 [Deltaproteobacteria bacterium]|nr:hypothetical protein [Deltaproteobacteria bacterium]